MAELRLMNSLPGCWEGTSFSFSIPTLTYISGRVEFLGTFGIRRDMFSVVLVIRMYDISFWDIAMPCGGMFTRGSIIAALTELIRSVFSVSRFHQ